MFSCVGIAYRLDLTLVPCCRRYYLFPSLFPLSLPLYRSSSHHRFLALKEEVRIQIRVQLGRINSIRSNCSIKKIKISKIYYSTIGYPNRPIPTCLMIMALPLRVRNLPLSTASNTIRSLYRQSATQTLFALTLALRIPPHATPSHTQWCQKRLLHSTRHVQRPPSASATTTGIETTPSSSSTRTLPTSRPPPLSLLPLPTLLRSYILTLIASSRFLLPPSLSLLRLIAHSPPTSLILNPNRNPLLAWLLRKTFYAQYCAGETPRQVNETVRALKDVGFAGVMLAAAREIVIPRGLNVEDLKREGSRTEREDVEAWEIASLESLEMVEKGDFVALKLVFLLLSSPFPHPFPFPFTFPPLVLPLQPHPHSPDSIPPSPPPTTQPSPYQAPHSLTHSHPPLTPQIQRRRCLRNVHTKPIPPTHTSTFRRHNPDLRPCIPKGRSASLRRRTTCRASWD